MLIVIVFVFFIIMSKLFTLVSFCTLFTVPVIIGDSAVLAQKSVLSMYVMLFIDILPMLSLSLLYN